MIYFLIERLGKFRRIRQLKSIGSVALATTCPDNDFISIAIYELVTRDDFISMYGLHASPSVGSSSAYIVAANEFFWVAHGTHCWGRTISMHLHTTKLYLCSLCPSRMGDLHHMKNNLPVCMSRFLTGKQKYW